MPVNAGWPAPIETRLQHRFYQAVIFLFAVTTACATNRQPVVQDLSWQLNDTSVTIFKDFVNRLCQFCDVKPGGDSVTAFAVLDLQQRIQYRFASNKRNKTQLERARKFVIELLKVLRDATVEDSGVRIQVLSKVLGFCHVKIQNYMRALIKASNTCMDTRTLEAISKDQLQDLGELRDATKFADFASLDVVSRANRFQSLIVTIDRIRGSEDSVFRERAAQSSMIHSSNCWSELRHFAGRLLSFSQGVETMIIASERFPRLFDDPEVICVPSSTPGANPIQESVTSEKILRRMTATPQMAQYYQNLVSEARALPLEDIIQHQVNLDTFKPIVHAELLVLQSLEKEGLTHPSNFFNAWKYIGSSKPTCRMCDYYFRAHNAGFEVRPTHGNLYINWKPPDVYQRDGETAVKSRNDIMNAIVVWVRQEALRTLVEKVPRGKQHDSTTGMTIQPLITGNPTAAGLPGSAGDLETFLGDLDDSSD